MANHYKFWTKEEKYEIIKPILNSECSVMDQSRLYQINSGMICIWLKGYRTNGIQGLENKKKTGNPLSKYSKRKELTELEQKDYEILKLRIENERLKKGYFVKGDGTVQISTKLKQKSSK